MIIINYFQDHISLSGSRRSKLVVHVVPTKTASMDDQGEEAGVGGGGGGEEEGAGEDRRGEGEGEGGAAMGEEETDNGGAALAQVSMPGIFCWSSGRKSELIPSSEI